MNDIHIFSMAKIVLLVVHMGLLKNAQNMILFLGDKMSLNHYYLHTVTKKKLEEKKMQLTIFYYSVYMCNLPCNLQCDCHLLLIVFLLDMDLLYEGHSIYLLVASRPSLQSMVLESDKNPISDEVCK